MTKNKSNQLVIIAAVIILAILIVAVMMFTGKDSSQTIKNETETGSDSGISAVELADNKEKYEGKQVLIKNVLVPDPNFALVERETGEDERLFISPKKSTYCLNFNLEGKLQKDSVRGWIFNVSKFECVK